ncbi:MAG: FHA domain-containing protein, partial [Gemmataceae bacterium]|nr:FHA domain-containing protein [Gemmataceae bacterium]
MTQPTGATSQTPTNSLATLARLPGGLDVKATHRATGAVTACHVPYPHAVLGRAPQAGVRLEDPSVSQCHALLQLVDGVPYCIDLGSRTGVMWDDAGQGRGWIHPGQTVRVGLFDVQVTGNPAGDPPAPEAADAPPAVLDVYSPAGPSGRLTLDQPVTLVGRHPNCNL